MASLTPAQIAAGQRRTLRAMRTKVIAMAEAWDGVDGCAVTELEELAEQIQKNEEFLNEPVANTHFK